MEKINIGITVKIDSPTESLFSNGIKQNAIVLRETFKEIEFVKDVYFINFGAQKDLSKSPWKPFAKYVINFEEALKKVNVIVTATALIADTFVERAHKKGIKLINLVLGNEYYGFCESVLFTDDGRSVSKNKGYSASWMTPQHYETNRDLMEAVFDSKTELCPYIWSPDFIQGHINEFQGRGKSTDYKNHGQQKRLSIFEPNINMVKTSIFPMVIAEKLHKKRPDVLKHVNVFGTEKIKKKKAFIEFASSLDVYKNKKMSFEDRFPIVWSLTEHTDVVLSHQQDNALNYIYFDVAWLGWPLVHNAHMVKELGWYYSGFFADDAVNKLIEVMENFDKNESFSEEYKRRSREYISNFLPKHPRNVLGYKVLLEKLF